MSVRRLEAQPACDYRPAFCTQMGGRSMTRSRAMQLTPSDWSPLLADERTQVILIPRVGFMNVESELADYIGVATRLVAARSATAELGEDRGPYFLYPGHIVAVIHCRSRALWRKPRCPPI